MSLPGQVAALVLAAGSSRRMGGANKLLCPLAGDPLVARAVDAVLASRARPVWIVTGHEAERVRAALGDRPLRYAHNPEHEAGMGRSLAVGVAALAPPPDGVLVCLGDMPGIAPASIDALLAAFDPGEPGGIWVPVRAGRRGHPVLFGAAHLPALRRLSGDVGARALLARHAGAVREIELDDPGIHADVDTRADLAGLAGGPEGALP